jgi:hypothetical protein
LILQSLIKIKKRREREIINKYIFMHMHTFLINLLIRRK